MSQEQDSKFSLLELEPREETKPAAQDKPSVTCPRCSESQPDTDRCHACGFVLRSPVIARTKTVQQEQVADVARENVVQHHEVPASRNVYLVTVVVAILGAMLWKFIAIKFDYELGLVAWLVGGAIGLVPYSMGAKADSTAIACAVFALLSILGGKWMAAQAFHSSAMVELENEMKVVFEEQVSRSESFKAVVYDDESLKQFMVDHDYSEAENSDEVTEEEVEAFHRDDEESLINIQRGDAAFANWKSGLDLPLDEVSTTAIFVELLGFKDLIFILLGVTTAYRLGRGHLLQN